MRDGTACEHAGFMLSKQSGVSVAMEKSSLVAR